MFQEIFFNIGLKQEVIHINNDFFVFRNRLRNRLRKQKLNYSNSIIPKKCNRINLEDFNFSMNVQ